MHKKSILLSLLFISLLIQVAHGRTYQFSTAHASDEDIVELTILHTSDLHGYGFPRDVLAPQDDLRSGGLFSLATLIAEKRRELWRHHPEHAKNFMRSGRDDGILLLDAGDNVSGTHDDALTEGQNMVKLMNSPLLDYDAVTIGNHSADYGARAMYRMIAMRRMPVIISNAWEKPNEEGLPNTVPWHIFNIRGVRVGIFGLSHDRSTRIDGVTMSPVVETARKLAKELRPRADIVILLGHLGLEREKEWLAGLATVKEIDLIIDGHSHADIDYKVGHILAVQAGKYGLRCGELRLSWNKRLRKLQSATVTKHSLLVGDQKPSHRLRRTFSRLVAEVERENNSVIAKDMHGFFMKKTPRGAKTLPNAAAEFVARSMFEEPLDGTYADVGMVYQKGVRNHVAANDSGDVTKDLLHRVVPFGEKVVLVKRTGAQLKNLVSYGLKRKFSWAGIKVVAREKEGPRGPERELIDVTIYDRNLKTFVPVDDEATYKLACVSFFSRVFVRPEDGDVTKTTVDNKAVLRDFIIRHGERGQFFFSAGDSLAESLVID